MAFFLSQFPLPAEDGGGVGGERVADAKTQRGRAGQKWEGPWLPSPWVDERKTPGAELRYSCDF